MTSVLKEMYSKCLAQENEISKEISKMVTYPIESIDKVKQKIEESLDNYNNSINLLNISIEKSNISNEEKEIWKRKKEYFEGVHNNLIKNLEDCYIKKKKKQINYNFNFENENNIELGRNINNLEREKESWNSVYKLSTEIYDQTLNVNNELNNQILSLGNIGAKVTNIFHTITGSYHDSNWIKQRGQNDKYICIALGVLTIFIIGFTYFYLRPKIRG